MTTIVSVCERWAMRLEDPPEDDEWFASWVLRSPKNASRHITAGWHAVNSLRHVWSENQILTCTEYFGGMGAQALIAEHVFPWIRRNGHRIYDWSQDAVDHINREVRPHTPALRADSYEEARRIPASDLVLLDFGDLTVWKTREGERHRALLDTVFSYQPRAVVFTDIACRYLHLHRERYETLLGPGTCATYDSYLIALVHRFEELWGYKLVRGFYDRWSAVMALVPGKLMKLPNELIDTPSMPVGLELL